MLLKHTSVHNFTHLKLLELKIDKHRNWISHINYARFKLIFYHHNSLKVTSKTWGVSKKLENLVQNNNRENYNIWGRHLERNTHKKDNNEANFHSKNLFITNIKLLQNNICRCTHHYYSYTTDSNSTKI